MVNYRRLSKVLLAAAAAIYAGGAAAPALASISLKFNQVEPGSGVNTPLHFNGGSVTAHVGQLHWEADNDLNAPPIPMVDSATDGDVLADNVISFCIELGQHVSGSWKTYTKSAVSDAPDPSVSGSPNTGFKIGVNRAEALDVLADNYWSLATGSNVVDAVAFQLAVWELVHESPSGDDDALPGTLDVSQNSGTFYVNSTSGTDLQNAIAKANSWLSGLGSLTPDDSLSLIALTHTYKQDQIVQYVSGGGQGGPQLPEPTALLVWSCLGACVGLATSRRGRS